MASTERMIDKTEVKDLGGEFFRPLAWDDDMTGADVRAALDALMNGARPGTRARRYFVLELAFQLGVATTTVYRWTRTGRMTRENFTKLREYVGRRQASMMGAPADHWKVVMLRRAHGHLVTGAEREAEARTAASVAAFLCSRRDDALVGLP
jgi:hypothetical protein